MNSTTQTLPPPDDAPQLVLPGRGTSAGSGWDWIVGGWNLFTRAPLMWILALIIVVVIAFIMGLVPIIGSLAFQILQPVLAAGFIVACRSLEKGGEFELEHLFQGFSKRFVPLMIVGLLVMVGWILIILVFMVFVGMSLLSAFLTGDPNQVAAAVIASGMQIALGSLVALALMVPLMAAYWFAPALVMMHDVPPITAMKESLFACIRNIIPFLVNGIVMLFFAILAVIPFGLGMLVWIPVAFASTYVAYRQIFTEPD